MTAWKIVPKEADIICPKCNGSGRIQAMNFKSSDATVDRPCNVCKGTGWILRQSASPVFEPTEAMVERAARVLCRARALDPETPLYDKKLGFDRPAWHREVRVARAVLSQLNGILEG